MNFFYCAVDCCLFVVLLFCFVLLYNNNNNDDDDNNDDQYLSKIKKNLNKLSQSKIVTQHKAVSKRRFGQK